MQHRNRVFVYQLIFQNVGMKYLSTSELFQKLWMKYLCTTYIFQILEISLIVNIGWYPRVCILGSFNNYLLLLTPEYNWLICFMPGVKYVWFIVNDLWYFRGRRVMFITWFVGGNRLHWLGIHLGKALYHHGPYKIRTYGIRSSTQILNSIYNSGIRYFTKFIYHILFHY